jgi:hypothetical protein
MACLPQGSSRFIIMSHKMETAKKKKEKSIKEILIYMVPS